MQPRDLKESDFKTYLPLARALACANLPVMRTLPIALAAVLLRDVITLDTCFPTEQRIITARFSYLASLSADQREHLTRGFSDLTLPAELIAEDWVRDPRKFEEDLSAYLWASHQIDHFRVMSEQFVETMQKALPVNTPATRRWSAVVLGPELRKQGYPIFRKLRPHGVFFPSVATGQGSESILKTLASRSLKTPVPYGHWYIEGASLLPIDSNQVSKFSWAESAQLRAAVLSRVENVIGSGSAGPEKLRTLMAGWKASGETADTGDRLVNNFVQRVYDEGSGTQIFSTTFVQWAARELLRRAEPVSLVARFGPRQKQRNMNEMFATPAAEMDMEGSLVDGDFGAYYTWINLNRLAGAQSSMFIAWSEGHQQAVAIGPGLPRGTEAPDTITLAALLRMTSET